MSLLLLATNFTRFTPSFWPFFVSYFTIVDDEPHSTKTTKFENNCGVLCILVEKSTFCPC